MNRPNKLVPNIANLMAWGSLLVMAVITAYLVCHLSPLEVFIVVLLYFFLIIMVLFPEHAFYFVILCYPLISERISIRLAENLPALRPLRLYSLFLFVYLISQAQRKEIFERRFISPEKLMVAMITLLGISSFRASHPMRAIQVLWDSFITPFLFYLFVKTKIGFPSNRAKICLVFVILGLYSSLIGILQYITKSDLGFTNLYPGMRRISGPFISAEVFGSVLGIAIPFLLYLFLETKQRETLSRAFSSKFLVHFLSKSFFALSTLSMVLGIFVSFFRTCWFTFVAQLCALSFSPLRVFKKYARLAFIGSLLVFILGSKYCEPLGRRLMAKYSVYDRILLAETAIYMGLKNPVWGVGFTNFRYLYGHYLKTGAISYYYSLALREEVAGGRKLETHNSYLQILAEGGIIVFLLFISILLIFLKRLTILFKYTYRERSFLEVGWSVTLALIFIAFAVPQFFQSMIYYSSFVNVTFFIAMGFLTNDFYRIIKIQENRENENESAADK